MAFGIAEAHVVFDQFGLAVLNHEADEKDAFKRRAAFGHLVHAGLYDLGECLLRDGIGHHGRGGVGAHATCVWASVAVADAFMVLGRANGQHGFTVAEDEKGGFFARQEFFDHDFCACLPKGAVEHVVDCGQSLGLGHGDDDAFACCQTVSFDNDWRAVCADVGTGGLGVGEMTIGGSGRA